MSKSELRKLIGLYCDGALAPDEAERLKEMLRADVDARREFLQHTDLHARLCWEFGAGVSAEACGECESTSNPERRSAVPTAMTHDSSDTWSRRLVRPTTAWVGLAMAIGVAVTVATWWMIASPPAGPRIGPQSTTLATLQRGVGVRWRGSDDYRVGDAVHAGPLELLAGLAVLKTADGAEILMEAPVRLELIDARNAFLHFGRIVVHADAPDGFVVDTDRVRVVDKGTEFGVGVEPSGDAVVQVFSGKVLADFKQVAGAPQRSMELTAGEACSITGSAGSLPSRLPFTPERFVRTFPEPDGQKDFRPAFQTESRIETVDVVPAPPDIVVDGELSDWNRGGEFFGRFDPPYGDNYNIRGSMMYDRQFLYIGAHVRDPAPMRSVMPPNADHSYCYRGGSVQVRLCVDASKSWPLPEYYQLARKRIADAKSKKPDLDFLVHLTMWYAAPEHRPCLQISYGLPPLKSRANDAQQWQGAYQVDADGLGYTLEYAIPWRLLKEDATAPRPGDDSAVCWHVNFSDRTGRLRVAQLTECVHLANIRHPDDLIDCWRQSASWGRARFLEGEAKATVH